MKKKLKKLNNKGFTLIELLCSMMILSLLTVVMAIAISYGVKYYNETVLYSEAKTLSSTINTVISDELRYAKNIKEQITDAAGYGKFSYDSALYGSGCRITASADQENVIVSTSSGVEHKGKLCIVNPNKDGAAPQTKDVPDLYIHYLLGDGSYTHGLNISNVKIMYNSSTRVFNVSYDINNANNEVVLGDIELDVKVLGKN